MSSMPAGIIAKINRSGGSLTARDGELVLRVPPGTLSDDDLALVREHKQKIVRILSETPLRLVATASGDRIDVHCPDAETAQRLEAGRGRVEEMIRGISQPTRKAATNV